MSLKFLSEFENGISVVFHTVEALTEDLSMRMPSNWPHSITRIENDKAVEIHAVIQLNEVKS